MIPEPSPSLQWGYAHRYVQPRRCECGSTQVFGEPGWRCCTDCGRDELKNDKMVIDEPDYLS